jgi:hypothetical protein
MNTESNRPTPGGPDEEPVVIGAGLRPVEDRLRRSLADEARSITPSDRLGVILTEAHDVRSRTRPRRWLVPAVAAAAAVLVAGTVWAVNRPSAPIPPATAVSTSTTPQATTPPTTEPSSVPTQTATGPTTGPSATTPPATVPPVTTPASVPVYYIGAVADGSADLRLFREFVNAPVAKPVGAESKALAALKLAMGAQVPSGSSYIPVWSGVEPRAVAVTKAGYLVTLSGGLPSAPPGGSNLAVQQLVWTVQAAGGEGPLQVRFVVPGDADVAPGMPSDRPYERPTDAIEVSALLAPIWVDEPFRGQSLKSGSRLSVKGVASTFEANVQWQLLKSGAEVEQGFTTASIGAPGRGTYTFRPTTTLEPGDYVIRVFESSAKDGSVAAEQRVPFTVR